MLAAQTQAPGAMTTPGEAAGFFGHTCDIGTLLTQVASSPEVNQDIADKISFLMNNLAESNVETSAAELKRCVTPDDRLLSSANLLVGVEGSHRGRGGGSE